MRGILEWRVDLCDRCNHIQPTKTIAVLYCVALSTCFVGCLYAFVPSTIRALDRNHAQQIRRRVMVASIMSAASTLIYPIVFCSDGPESNKPSPSALEIMGWKSSLQPLFGVLVHTSLLYLGPIVTSLLHFHITCRRRVLDSSPFALLCAYFVHPLLSPFFDPVIGDFRANIFQRVRKISSSLKFNQHKPATLIGGRAHLFDIFDIF